ncbi:MAG: hypothetical protein VR74_20070 [Hyphomonas sp. BRH_c22]|nr:MAG: hypothetical protein VR74_20070 [Hyphomonas sp. BRH_c22]
MGHQYFRMQASMLVACGGVSVLIKLVRTFSKKLLMSIRKSAYALPPGFRSRVQEGCEPHDL